MDHVRERPSDFSATSPPRELNRGVPQTPSPTHRKHGHGEASTRLAIVPVQLSSSCLLPPGSAICQCRWACCFPLLFIVKMAEANGENGALPRAIDAKPKINDDYVLTRDAAASARLNLSHYVWLASFGFNLHPRIADAVSGREGLKVADIGTGTG